MYSEKYEFSAVHETGHAVCAERFLLEPRKIDLLSFPPLESLSPSRIRYITFGYDETAKRFDGLTVCNPQGLSDEQILFYTLGGRVAELMARTEGTWNVTEIQTRHLSEEFDQTRDSEHVENLLAKLCSDNKNNERDQILVKVISQVFSFLKENWDTVEQVVSDLLSKYDYKAQKAMVSYDDFLPETQEQLRQLKRASFQQ